MWSKREPFVLFYGYSKKAKKIQGRDLSLSPVFFFLIYSYKLNVKASILYCVKKGVFLIIYLFTLSHINNNF